MFATCSAARAQENTEIVDLKKNIKALEASIQKQAEKEKSTTATVEKIDEKINLNKQLITKLEKQFQKKKSQTAALENESVQLEMRLEKLKEMFAQRVVSLYKYGRIPTLQLVLSAENVNQIAIWAEYQRKLAENDIRLYEEIKQKQSDLIETHAALSTTIAEQRNLLKEQQNQQQTLVKDRESKKDLLKQIRRDKKHYQTQLENYQEEIKRIQELIAESERRANEPDPEPENDAHRVIDAMPEVNFSALKGKLEWPLKGKIVRDYGTYKHPELKTITENLGIDIEAKKGQTVHSVAVGKVTAITWQRGRGNLIIINHSEGYYTVYTHLDEIIVDLYDNVTAGQQVGIVGDVGLRETPIIHFQVWQKIDHLNPNEWLR